MKKFLGRVLAVVVGSIIAIVILSLILFFGVGYYTQTPHEKLPEKIVLTLDLSKHAITEIPGSEIRKFSETQPLSLLEIMTTLSDAAEDPHVSAFVTKMGPQELSVAQIQELREAVQNFAAKGKKTFFYADSFGEFGPGNLPYYLATAYDQIWMQPSGGLGLTGLAIETPFMYGLLQKLGIKAEFSQRYEFKGGPEPYLRENFSPTVRQSLSDILTSLFDQLVTGIGNRRAVEEDQLRLLIDEAPLLPQTAKEQKLVDELGYWDQLQKSIEKNHQEAKFIDFAHYFSNKKPIHNPKAKIALIYATGEILRGVGRSYPSDALVDSEILSETIREAADDSELNAIILRVDSPGGSYTASDTIWRELEYAKEKKPLIVSMGGVAASGGYFIALPGDKILASPGTVTGSIGIYGGKFAIEELANMFGITWDTIEHGQNSSFWSMVRPFSPRAWEQMNAFLDASYIDFTAKVRQARKLTEEQVDLVARGRVFTGEAALKLGLIDELGGLVAAIQTTKSMISGVHLDDPVELVLLPRAENPVEKFINLIDLFSFQRGKLEKLLNQLDIGQSETGLRQQKMPEFTIH